MALFKSVPTEVGDFVKDVMNEKNRRDYRLVFRYGSNSDKNCKQIRTNKLYIHYLKCILE